MATPAQYATTRPVTHETTTATSTPTSYWNLTRTMVVMGAATILLAVVIHERFLTAFDPFPFFLLAPGFVFSLVLLKYARPWVYLTAGLLNAVLPLMVLGVFGEARHLLDTKAGYDWGSLTLLLGGLLLSVTGGIAGFVRARKSSDIPFGSSWGTGLGTFAIVTALVLFGTGIAGALVGFNQANAAAAGGWDFAVEDIGGVSLGEMSVANTFKQNAFQVTAGQVTEITIANEDVVLHTFTYQKSGETYSHDLVGGATTSFLVLFADVGTIAFRCVPHSSGYEDDGNNMVGSFEVVAAA